MKKLSISISGHATSFSLEEEFADALKKIAADKNKTVAALVREIDARRGPDSNLSSATRIWILQELQKKAKLSA
ncbi:MAG: ribbon-helix-helix domain-containing protein [Rickettsiales bacterium]|jgi:predicted DNA-binding ribbon-helix-helix protein|nr:ribbon-helix-helix domain-containing protein [Rickettsiales bacterium]